MATIKRQVVLDRHADEVWNELSDFSAAGRLFAGVLTGCETRDDLRVVTFANGRKVTEKLVTLDRSERRLAYTVLDGSFTHHMASMQILPEGAGSVFVWISDFLPDAAAPGIVPLVEAGCQAFRLAIGRV